jgi:hypothetical protein
LGSIAIGICRAVLLDPALPIRHAQWGLDRIILIVNHGRVGSVAHGLYTHHSTVLVLLLPTTVIAEQVAVVHVGSFGLEVSVPRQRTRSKGVLGLLRYSRCVSQEGYVGNRGEGITHTSIDSNGIRINSKFKTEKMKKYGKKCSRVLDITALSIKEIDMDGHLSLIKFMNKRRLAIHLLSLITKPNKFYR